MEVESSYVKIWKILEINLNASRNAQQITDAIREQNAPAGKLDELVKAIEKQDRCLAELSNQFEQAKSDPTVNNILSAPSNIATDALKTTLTEKMNSFQQSVIPAQVLHAQLVSLQSEFAECESKRLQQKRRSSDSSNSTEKTISTLSQKATGLATDYERVVFQASTSHDAFQSIMRSNEMSAKVAASMKSSQEIRQDIEQTHRMG